MSRIMRNKVAYIVVGWNNKDILGECFESLAKQTYKHVDVYYVDNGSADNSVEFVRESFPDVIIIEPGYNTGFAKGNNIGIAQALQDETVGYIGLLNSDARLHPDWSSQLVAFAETKSKAALLQGTTLDYYNHAIIDSTHIYISLNGQGTQGNWRAFDGVEFGPKKIFGVNAAACIITRNFIEAQPFGYELFDETMFMYLEDVDLGTRATFMGWDNYLVPAARAYHMGSASSGKNPGFSLYMTFRNNSALLYKNFGWKRLLKMSPSLLRGDIDTIRVLRRMGKKDAAKKVFRGRINGLFRIPKYYAKRKKMQKVIAIPEEYMLQLMRRGY